MLFLVKSGEAVCERSCSLKGSDTGPSANFMHTLRLQIETYYANESNSIHFEVFSRFWNRVLAMTVIILSNTLNIQLLKLVIVMFP